MSEALKLIGACAAGGLLGLFFFGGLWWTVRKGTRARWAALWFSGSLLVRSAVVLAGFYLVSAWQWPRLLACVAGFAVARGAATWFIREPR